LSEAPTQTVVNPEGAREGRELGNNLGMMEVERREILGIFPMEKM